ncbi:MULTISPECIES: GNAT family N-acetyltransferase [Paraliobacillus]|uniref:GNAT family N-acetyltransferase n=1 Tax=Paraliobacillus TaxID=200903 RepID=UPI000DD3F7A7|nr:MULTISPECIES: GNAT family N-acetyltransferase [Paraliobacillus]
MPHIETKRLLIITLTPEIMEAALLGRDKLEKAISYDVSSEWPMDVYKQFFPYKIQQFKESPAVNDWEGMVILKDKQLIIGDIGFKGGPNEKGIIDLGYSVIPSQRRKGYATEMANAMVNWGVVQSGVEQVVATSDPDNIASKRVLEKSGFHKVKQTNDTIYWLYS